MSQNKHVIVIENLERLFKAIHDDSELLEFVLGSIKSFGHYHQAIMDMETWLKLYDYSNLSREEYQDKRTQLDKYRTTCHNAVLSSINILNRLAAKYSIPSIYDGTVSEEQPYRREVADAVIQYMEDVIKKRT